MSKEFNSNTINNVLLSRQGSAATCSICPHTRRMSCSRLVCSSFLVGSYTLLSATSHGKLFKKEQGMQARVSLLCLYRILVSTVLSFRTSKWYLSPGKTLSD